MSSYEFTVDGTRLTGTDSFGCEWHCEDAAGWLGGGAGVRTDPQARMQQNGEWRGRGFRSGLRVLLRGTVVCPDEAAAETAARRLGAVLSSGGFGKLEGTGPSGRTLSSLVQLEVESQWELLSERVAAWQLGVGSEDPLLYGASVYQSTTLASIGGGGGLVYPLAYPLDYGETPDVIPGALFLPNEGTASYLPRVRITGPVPNPIVTLSGVGDWLKYNGTIPAGSYVDIECDTRRVIFNGQVSHRHRVTSQGGWLGIAPGGAWLSWTADAADPDALFSAWGYEGAWI